MYTIRGNGNLEYGRQIIKFFESLGGVDTYKLRGISDQYYFINNNNQIDCCIHNINKLKEVSLLSNGMAKGVWYKDYDDWYIKPNNQDKGVYGETIYRRANKYTYTLDNGYSGGFKTLNYLYENAKPLSDLSEIQPYLPYGHEDKIDEIETELKIEIDNNSIKINGVTTIKEAINELQKQIK